MVKIIVRIAQGLANRMFQTAYALSLQKKGYEVKIDYVINNKYQHEDVDIFKVFPDIHFAKASELEITDFGGKDTLISKVIRRIPFASKVVIIPFDKPFKLIKNDFKKDSYLIGTFQSEDFFANVVDEVKRLYTFPLLMDERNLELAREMFESESVAIHIRKGNDYKKDILKNTCTIEYYNKAIDYIKSNLKDPRFYIFTDNVEWVVQNFSGCNYTLVDWNPIYGSQNYVDMQLMSMAKHNIIANSTYSWWGAWLNANTNKIVIAPKYWYNPHMDKLQNLDIVPSDWINF